MTAPETEPQATASCRECKSVYEPAAHEWRRRRFLCSDCRIQYDRDYRARRKAAGNPVKPGRVPLEAYREWHVEYSQRPEVRERRREHCRHRRLDPVEAHKNSVRYQTREAIRRGVLVRQPCEVCGEAKVDAHHDNYGDPMTVRWLCRFHHAQHHAHVKRAKSASEAEGV